MELNYTLQISITMKYLFLLLLITACSTEPVINKNEPTYTTDKTGYYWRGTYNHRWGNAPPPGDRWHQ